MENLTVTDSLIKVSGSSKPSAVAGAIAGMMRQHRSAKVQAIGANAVNQAVKAMAIAYRYLQPDGICISFAPFFVAVPIDDEEKTAICFHVVISEPIQLG
jgi:stage V sporulation protein S